MADKLYSLLQSISFVKQKRQEEISVVLEPLCSSFTTELHKCWNRVI